MLKNLGLADIAFEPLTNSEFANALQVKTNGDRLAELGQVSQQLTTIFDIKQPVFAVDFNWDNLLLHAGRQVRFREIPKFPSVERDLALVVPKSLNYSAIRDQINRLKLNKLRDLKLFDVFESEKFGADRKSMAINLTFLDEEKTLTDKEIDGWMNKIMITLEKELQAEIRK